MRGGPTPWLFGQEPAPGGKTARVYYTFSARIVTLTLPIHPDNLFGCSLYPEWPLGPKQCHKHGWRKPYDAPVFNHLYAPLGEEGYAKPSRHSHIEVITEAVPPGVVPRQAAHYLWDLVWPYEHLSLEKIARLLCEGAPAAFGLVLYRATRLRLEKHLVAQASITLAEEERRRGHTLVIGVTLCDEGAVRLDELRLVGLFRGRGEIFYPDIRRR